METESTEPNLIEKINVSEQEVTESSEPPTLLNIVQLPGGCQMLQEIDYSSNTDGDMQISSLDGYTIEAVEGQVIYFHTFFLLNVNISKTQ